MTEWQPIETAPKDGTPILLACKTVEMEIYGPDLALGGVVKARWAVGDYQEESEWLICDTCYYSAHPLNPTHWMHLPKPPEEV